MKPLVALAIVVSGVVAAFAIYTFGWHGSSESSVTTTSVTTATGRHRLYTIRQGDLIRFPATATECEATGEAGIPNLFCTRLGPRARYQVVFWGNGVDVYDLALHGEPMVPTFSVPASIAAGSR